MLKVIKLNKTINGTAVLNNLSLHIRTGEIAVLLGKSGAGKSTLLRILSGIEHSDSGEIEIDTDQKSVGMVFQHFNLFDHLTVLGNITLALVKVKKMPKHEAEAYAGRLLVRYGLEGKEHTMVGRLSGGQKQRVAIARTVALNPDVVCLDEPTSALDPQLTRHVAAFIADLAAEGKAVIVTSHDLGLVDRLDATLYYMEKGCIAESGTTSALKSERNAFPLLSRFISGH